MKLRPMSRALIAGALLIAPNLARADLIYETTYLSGDSVLLPTSYAMPTSYTSYLTPTVATSYLTPTSAYVSPDDVLFPTTSYVATSRRVRRPRRYVERTAYYVTPRYAVSPTSYVLPTTYLVPTSYVTSSILPTSYLLDTSLVATSASSSDCGTLATTPMPTSRAVAPPQATNSAAAAERKPSAAVQSSPANDNGEPSPLSAPLPSPANTTDTRSSKAAPAPTSPTSPAAAPDSSQLDTGVGTSPTPPPIQVPEPGSMTPSNPNDAAGAQTRQTFRPIYSSPSAADVRLSSRARNVLRGRVVAYDNGKAEEGVTVYLTSRTGAFSDRTTMTDADGRFAVSLPDGDWAVKVRMPSGTVMPVTREDVTASAGRVMDAAGRGVQEFVITR